MKIPLARRFAAVLPLVLAAAACNPPKYASYESVNKDYTVSVPWGWQVMTDQQGDSFTQATFIGPFDPDFYLGAPSLSVRWFKKYRPHKLQGGRLELYTGVDDFIKQMLTDVYGPNYVLFTLNDKSEELSYRSSADGKTAIDVIPEITLAQSGLPSKGFTVLSAAPASPNAHWGVSVRHGDDKPQVVRKHSYVVVPMDSGFYVLTYPATDTGYYNYRDTFNGLIGSFMPYTDGPGGAKIRVPGPQHR